MSHNPHEGSGGLDQPAHPDAYDVLTDPARLQLIRDIGLLEPSPDRSLLQRTARIAARALRAPVAQVNLVTDRVQVPVVSHVEAGDRHGRWSTAVPLEQSFCQFVITSDSAVVARDSRLHPLLRYSAPATDGEIIGYIGVPIRVKDDGHSFVLGSMCVVDEIPRNWTAEDVTTLEDCAAVVSNDLTSRLLAIAQVQTADRIARDASERANRAKSEFLAMMSHELRTPLNAIGGYADLLDLGLRGPITTLQREDLSRIRRNQQHLLVMINDILNLAKLEAGHIQYTLAPVDMRGLLQQVSRLLAPEFEARGLSFVTHECPEDLCALADRDKLQQVLMNLLDNAMKFTEAPGQVSIDCDGSEESVRVRVHDSGLGIPNDRLQAIFDPFVQVDPGLARGHEGAGLGLAISRDLSRGMAGELIAQSTLGLGSTFTLTLPRAKQGTTPPQ